MKAGLQRQIEPYNDKGVVMEKKSVAQDIRDLANRLEKIAEGDMDDLGLGDHGRELDRDEPAYNPDAKGDKFSLINQTAKILDSRTNPNPIENKNITL